MASQAARLCLLVAATLLASACATSSPQHPALADTAPWWESAGPCRIWVPIQPTPGRTPAWDPGPSTSRMSRAGDCRNLQADLPDGAVLIGTE